MTSGYAPSNGLRVYYEVTGMGRPLVLLPGGLLTIDCFDQLRPTLTATRQVIAIELQGHGRTAMTDRKMSIPAWASDVAGVMDHLGLDQADVFGFSIGGTVALQLALDQPGRVGRLAVGGITYRPAGSHDLPAGSFRLPTEQDFAAMRAGHERVSPEPERFEEFADRVGATVHTFPGWTDQQLRTLAPPTLLMLGDHDFVRLEHAVAMFELLPDAQLAVLPNTTHMSLLRTPELVLPLLEGFLDPRATSVSQRSAPR